MKRPEAFVPLTPPPYVVEDDDKCIPAPGFISDFVASLRGVETPTLFCVWSALWVLSTLSARLSYLDWLPDSPLWPNLFIFLVAPPGRCHKSTAAVYARKILQSLPEAIIGPTSNDEFLRYMSEYNWATSKTTPDVVYELLKPQEKMLTGTDGTIKADKGSQIAICASELETFINKKKFTTGLVGTLTELYDCDSSIVIHTINRGSLELRDVFITMIGAITTMGMKESLPPEAYGEGFMSRVVVVFKEKTERRFRKPQIFAGFPTVASLRESLAFILRERQGVYRLTTEADAWLEKWYDDWRDYIDDDQGRNNERMGENRFDVNLLRIALLISMSRYENADRMIEKSDLLQANDLLKLTYHTSNEATTEAGISLEGGNEHYGKVAGYVRKKKKATRQEITSAMSSKRISMTDVKEALMQLHTEERIKVYGADRKAKDKVEWCKNESYEWCAMAEGEQ
jgi:hypothetical protein